MPVEHKQFFIKRRNISSVTDPDEEEEENDHTTEDCEKIEDKELNIQPKSQREFSELHDDIVCSAKKSFVKC